MGFRQVTEADVAPVASRLAAAFSDNPTYRYGFRESPSLESDLEAYFSAAVGWTVNRGPGAMTICDESVSGAVMVYRQPGQYARRQATFASPTVAERAKELSGWMAPLMPTGPHLLLAVIGVDPARQGEGIGAGLIEQVIALRGKRPVPIATITSSEVAAAWLQRRGFVPTGSKETDAETGLPQQYALLWPPPQG